MFTNKKREGINRFVCDFSLYVAKTPKASIKYHKPPFPIIPFGIVAYGFVGQPFSKQLYIALGFGQCCIMFFPHHLPFLKNVSALYATCSNKITE